MGSKTGLLSNTTRFVTWVCPHLWLLLCELIVYDKLWVANLHFYQIQQDLLREFVPTFGLLLCELIVYGKLWVANLRFYQIQQDLLREFVPTFGLLLWQTSIFMKYNNICYVNLSSPLGSSYGKPPFWWNTTTFVTWICPHLWAPLMWLFFGTYPLTHNPK